MSGFEMLSWYSILYLKPFPRKSWHIFIYITRLPFYTQTTNWKYLHDQNFSTIASLIITKDTVTIEAGQKLNKSTDLH